MNSLNVLGAAALTKTDELGHEAGLAAGPNGFGVRRGEGESLYRGFV